MKILKIILCSASVACATGSLYAGSYDDLVLDPPTTAVNEQGDYADFDALLGNEPASLSRGPHHGGGFGRGGFGHRGGGWFSGMRGWGGWPWNWGWGSPQPPVVVAPPVVEPAVVASPAPATPPSGLSQEELDILRGMARSIKAQNLLAPNAAQQQMQEQGVPQNIPADPGSGSPSSGGASPQ